MFTLFALLHSCRSNFRLEAERLRSGLRRSDESEGDYATRLEAERLRSGLRRANESEEECATRYT